MTLQPTATFSPSSEAAARRVTAPPTVQPAPLEIGQWVQLLTQLNPLSSDQALLLCRHDAEHWVTWVPDHGEAILPRHQLAVLP